jgi:hypothetical protein
MPRMPMLAKHIWGSNNRAESARAKGLGWKKQGLSFSDELPADVMHAVENRQCAVGTME